MQLTSQGGFAAFESPDGQAVYYAKGLNVAGLWKVHVNGGEEAPVLGILHEGSAVCLAVTTAECVVVPPARTWLDYAR